MATYTYKCLDCDNVFEIEATIQDKEENIGDKFICPKCKSESIKQEFSMTNFFRNVFSGDSGGAGCCSDKNSCDVSCKPEKGGEKDKKSCCEPKKGGGSCCG